MSIYDGLWAGIGFFVAKALVPLALFFAIICFFALLFVFELARIYVVDTWRRFKARRQK